MARKKHYETLDVAENATSEELKRAKKRKAREVHPDTNGGDAERMVEINRAFDCLNDPQRRLLYDQTGEDKQAQPIEQEIRTFLLTAFDQVLRNDNYTAGYVKHAERWMNAQLNNVKTTRSEVLATERKLKKKRDKVKTKGIENLFHMLIDQELQRIQTAILQLDRNIQIAEGALLELKNYESLKEESTTGMTVIFDRLILDIKTARQW